MKHLLLFGERPHPTAAYCFLCAHRPREGAIKPWYLLRFYKIGDVAIVVGAPDIEPGPGALAAQPGDEAGLGLLVSRVDGPDLDAPTHEAQQPVGTAHAVVLEVQVQRLVPGRKAGLRQSRSTGSTDRVPPGHPSNQRHRESVGSCTFPTLGLRKLGLKRDPGQVTCDRRNAFLHLFRDLCLVHQGGGGLARAAESVPHMRPPPSHTVSSSAPSHLLIH